MKKFITTASLALFVFSFIFSQDLYVRFNTVPNESGLLTGNQGSWDNTNKAVIPNPVNIINGIAADAYLMDAPVGESGIYSKTLTLPTGNYAYQIVFADGTGNQVVHNQVTLGRTFTITEEKEIVFRAKLFNNNGNDYIKFLCDGQLLHYSSSSTFDKNAIFSEPDENGNASYAFVFPNYKGAMEIAICPASSTVYTSDVLPTTAAKYRIPNAANGKVKWLISYNRYTLTLGELKKLVTLLDTDLIDTGNGFISAAELNVDLGSFSTKNPLLLGGGTTSVSARIGIDGPAGAEKANDLLKIKPSDIEAKMYYEIILNGTETTANEGAATLSTATDNETPEYEIAWTSEIPVNVTDGLNDGNYTLNIWYETVCYGDTVKSNVYTTSFDVNNTTTGIELTDINAQISTSVNTINATFDGTAEVKLYSVSGQIIDKAIATTNYTNTVTAGMYILSIADKTFKVLVK